MKTSYLSSVKNNVQSQKLASANYRLSSVFLSFKFCLGEAIWFFYQMAHIQHFKVSVSQLIWYLL